MFKGFVSTCVFLGLVAMTACTMQQQQDATKLLTQAKAQIANACSVVQPTLINLQAAYPNDNNVAAAVSANSMFCASIANVDQTNAQTIINTVVPDLIRAISALPLPAADNTTAQIALGAASVALSNFLIVYGQHASAPVGASS